MIASEFLCQKSCESRTTAVKYNTNEYFRHIGDAIMRFIAYSVQRPTHIFLVVIANAPYMKSAVAFAKFCSALMLMKTEAAKCRCQGTCPAVKSPGAVRAWSLNCDLSVLKEHWYSAFTTHPRFPHFHQPGIALFVRRCTLSEKTKTQEMVHVNETYTSEL